MSRRALATIPAIAVLGLALWWAMSGHHHHTDPSSPGSMAEQSELNSPQLVRPTPEFPRVVETPPSSPVPQLPVAANAHQGIAAEPKATGSVRVHVVDSAGVAIPGASVWLSTLAHPEDFRALSGPGRRKAMAGVIEDDPDDSTAVETNDSGTVELSDLDWGEWRALAQIDGLAPGTSEIVDLSELQPFPTAQVVLTPGGGIVGELRDVYGQPVPEFDSIGLFPSRLHSTWLTLDRSFATTQADGTFSFSNVSPGRWRVCVLPDEGEIDRIPDHTVDVVVVEGQTPRVVFPEVSKSRVVINGTLLADGKPVQGASVRVNLQGGFRDSDTNRSGRFRLILDKPGPCEFQISSSQSAGSAFIQREIPDVRELDLILAFETGSVSGRVLDANDKPVPDAEVQAQGQGVNSGAEATFVGDARTNALGEYILRGLTPGRYWLVAGIGGDTRTEGRDSATRTEVELLAGGSLERIDLRLAADGILEGVVTSPDGSAASGAMVTFRSRGSEGDVEAGADGRFTIEKLNAGQLWVRAGLGRSATPWREVGITSGATTRVNLFLQEGTRVSVELEDAQGSATAGVAWLERDGLREAVVVVVAGHGVSAPVAPGTYRVLVRQAPGDKSAPTAETSITLSGEPEASVHLRLP